MPRITEHTQAFTDGLNEKFADHPHRRGEFTATAGRKMDKVVHDGSVYAFVDRETGGVYKAATWSKPAAGVRYLNVADAVAEADLYGGFLYHQHPAVQRTMRTVDAAAHELTAQTGEPDRAALARAEQVRALVGDAL